MDDMARRPEFRYYPGFYEDAVQDKGVVCDCCGELGDVHTEMFYTSRDVFAVCPSCVASGRAAETFHGTFVARHDPASQVSAEALAELTERTPAFPAKRNPYWRAHCGDFCKYVGRTDPEALRREGAYERAMAEYDENVHQIPDLHERLSRAPGSVSLYRFECMKCGRPLIWAELA